MTFWWSAGKKSKNRVEMLTLTAQYAINSEAATSAMPISRRKHSTTSPTLSTVTLLNGRLNVFLSFPEVDQGHKFRLRGFRGPERIQPTHFKTRAREPGENDSPT